MTKRPRPSEIDRPDVVVQREALVRWRRRQAPARLVFPDGAGANLAMGRSRVWMWRGDAEVRFWIERQGARVKRLPPHSHHFNPIEPVWGLVRNRFAPYHCQQFFAHAGCGDSIGNRD